MTTQGSNQQKIEEEIRKVLSQTKAYNVIQNLTEVVLEALASQRQGYIKVLRKKIKWDVGTVEYTNPDGTKHRVYNADHIDKLIEQGEEE